MTRMRPPSSPRSYRLTIAGRLDAGRAAWFDGFVLTSEGNGTTSISGPVTDQAQLHGLLAKIRDLGVTLVSLEAEGEDVADAPLVEPPTAG